MLLRQQLEAMDDGGLVVISAPATPYPLPAGALRARQPDRALAQDQEAEVEGADPRRQGRASPSSTCSRRPGPQLYPGMIEWVPLSKGGKRDLGRSRDADRQDRLRRTTRPRSPTSSRRRRPAPSPPQAGVADRTGWCPVEPVAFESTLQPGIHVLGDAAHHGRHAQGGASPPTRRPRSAPRRSSPSCAGREPADPQL